MPARNLRAVPDQPSRVVCYVRVSALMGRGGDDFHSPDVQLGGIRRLITGMREVAVIDDIDQTGRNFNREGIDKIRAMAEAKQVDVVAVYDLSRVGRNAKEALAFIDDLAALGVGVISASENIDTTTPAGRLMLQQFLNLAEFYSNIIGKNWADVIARRAEQGLGHGQPTGYIRKDHALHVHPVDGPAIAQAFRDAAAGERMSVIVRRLAEALGRTVYPSVLRQQLRNPTYVGKVVNNGAVFDGKHEALVTPATWELVQKRMAREATMPARHLEPTWSMVGFTFCEQGHAAYRHTKPDTKGGPKVDRLLCGHRQYSTGCNMGQPRLAEVEEWVLDQVAEHVRLLEDDVAAREARQVRQTSARVERAGLEKQRDAVRTAMVKITKQWGLEQVDDATYQATIADYRASEASLSEALAAAETVVQLPSPVQLADAGKKLLAMWGDMTVPERNRVLGTVVEKVVIHRPKRWREPAADRTQVFLY
ncbi:hypothetical protein Cme02nite_38760 [Catellatospora methionotrophica]|uniref:Uncharacterized protein n=1 Tax=Catellatospora methionotrophica TaxID=121620 RepID=A0A8J3PGB7_9ACTN|nr:recombinase family protein [Catellatospora methionotrophica]GIG15544.1 hypothetical protein Cme02nite_38760 [Catellatospora methionotrophica]